MGLRGQSGPGSTGLGERCQAVGRAGGCLLNQHQGQGTPWHRRTSASASQGALSCTRHTAHTLSLGLLQGNGGSPGALCQQVSITSGCLVGGLATVRGNWLPEAAADGLGLHELSGSVGVPQGLAFHSKAGTSWGICNQKGILLPVELQSFFSIIASCRSQV